jgi:hypothetical protein
MIKTAFVCLLVLLVGSGGFAQKEMKAWTDWSQKDISKILNDSGWAQTQLETTQAPEAASAITNTGSRNMTPRDPSQPAPGSINSYITYFIRFLSAKPIRQAFARKLELENPSMDPQKVEQLKTWTDVSSNDYILIAVSAEAKDKTMGGSAIQAFRAATLDGLKDVTFLERKDGQRVQLVDFKPPGPDGLGAKFVFARALNNQPFMNESAGQVRFFSQMSKTIKLEARFKVSEMLYNGKLEY